MHNTYDKIFDVESFKKALSLLGFDAFWANFIQTYVHKKRPDLEPIPGKFDIDISSDYFSLDNIGDLYEIALEHVNKISKKELGQYYTPKDTADFMAKKILSMYTNDAPIADVCCGTGNLIISILQNMPKQDALNALLNKKLYLYDLDNWAIQVAVMKIAILLLPYGAKKIYNNIQYYLHCEIGNFLGENINLPANCSVISNPPYGRLPKNTSLWFDCETYITNEMFAVFVEKIAKQSQNSVIISPQSFLGSNKFSILRRVLSRYGGVIYAFDNVPASIFNGKKHGIFNTNSANSVRAAITIIDNKNKGFRITPLLRFKNCERVLLFNHLDNFLGNSIYSDESPWLKVPKTLETLVQNLKGSKYHVSDFITQEPNTYKLTIPSTPRYFVTASARNLVRGSAIEIYAKDEAAFNKLYIVLNSTISYLWWRICDGGITITKETLLNIPVPKLTTDLDLIVQEGKKLENSCVKIKLNAGKSNENIKFPDAYRNKLNMYILESLNSIDVQTALHSLHSNALKLILETWT